MEDKHSARICLMQGSSHLQAETLPSALLTFWAGQFFAGRGKYHHLGCLATFLPLLLF